jgi:hypothetical protein
MSRHKYFFRHVLIWDFFAREILEKGLWDVAQKKFLRKDIGSSVWDLLDAHSYWLSKQCAVARQIRGRLMSIDRLTAYEWICILLRVRSREYITCLRLAFHNRRPHDRERHSTLFATFPDVSVVCGHKGVIYWWVLEYHILHICFRKRFSFPYFCLFWQDTYVIRTISRPLKLI